MKFTNLGLNESGSEGKGKGWLGEGGGVGGGGGGVMRLDLGFRKVWSERERGHIQKINT